MVIKISESVTLIIETMEKYALLIENRDKIPQNLSRNIDFNKLETISLEKLNELIKNPKLLEDFIIKNNL